MKKIKYLWLLLLYSFIPSVVFGQPAPGPGTPGGTPGAPGALPGHSGTTATGGGALGDGISKAQDSGLSNTTFGNILYGAINFGAFLLGALGVLGFIISGILYITSTGNDDRMEMAKKGMMYSFIGIAVGGLGYAFVITMQKVFQGANTGF